MAEVVGGRIYGHAVSDVAAPRGVMVDQTVDDGRRIHRTSNLPIRDGIESAQRVATAMSKEVAPVM
jgi:hypothetical protein